VIDRIADFQDPHQEWRRLFSELFGTFLLVLVAAGGGMMGHAFPNTIKEQTLTSHEQKRVDQAAAA
jgi:aquaporin Z